MSEHTHVEVSSSQFLVFTSEANGTIEVRYEDGTIWLTQKLMAELFDVDVRTISEHLRNIYDSGELVAEATIRNFRIVRTEGSRQVTRGIDHYNLDARELLTHAGSISKKLADEHALREYESFRQIQDRAFISDFDRFAEEAHRQIESGQGPHVLREAG